MRGRGFHYALVRGARDTEHLLELLGRGLGYSIESSLRHKDGSLAWVVSWMEPFAPARLVLPTPLTVTELPYQHPLAVRARGESEDVEEDDVDDEDEAAS